MKPLWLLAAVPLLAAQTAPFEYRRDLPIDWREPGVEDRAGVKVHNITFANTIGGRTAAYYVTPTGKRKLAGILLYVHWYESEAADSNRTQFLSEAVSLAPKGAASLLIETMWSNTKWFFTRNQADDYDNSVRQVKELRRALDALLSRPEVDRTRVAFVGHDFGAMYGAVMAGVDRRPSKWVFIAGTSVFSDWYLLGSKWAGEKRQQFIEQMAPLDPTRYVGAASPSPVLFQFGRSDRFVPEAKAREFFDAAREPKRILWYDAGHDINEQAGLDRREWLAQQLKLK